MLRAQPRRNAAGGFIDGEEVVAGARDAYAAALEPMKAALDELCKLWGIGNR